MVERGGGVGPRGLTLLEILFAMVLFVVVIASFAMVYPSGYHLNLRGYRENQSVELANAILQEVANKPFYSPPGTVSMGGSLFDLSSNLSLLNPGTPRGWAGECPRSGGLPVCGCSSTRAWTPQALCDFYARNPVLAKEYNYALPAPGGQGQGVQVTFLSDGDLSRLDDNPLVQVTVHLSWQEPSNTGPIPRTLTLRTFATYDR